MTILWRLNMLEKLLNFIQNIEDSLEYTICSFVEPIIYWFVTLKTIIEYWINPDTEYWKQRIKEDQEKIRYWEERVAAYDIIEEKDIQNALLSTTLNIHNMRKNMLSFFDFGDSDQVREAFENSKTAVIVCLNALKRYGVVLPNQEKIDRITKMDIYEFETRSEVNQFFDQIISEISDFRND